MTTCQLCDTQTA